MKRLNYSEKLKEFEQLKDYKKFVFRSKELTFSDGVYMGIWFDENKVRIMNSNGELELSVKAQFNDYKNTTCKRKSFNQRLEEFLKIDNLLKYNTSKKNNLKFDDGILVRRWLLSVINNDEFKNNPDVIKQCYKYIEMDFSHIISEGFEKKLIEFVNEKDLYKFDGNSRHIFFSDGKVMSTWFNNFKDRIMDKSNVYYDELLKQYNEYKSRHGISNKVSFEDRLDEFFEADKLKYNANSNILFKDGASMYNWFMNHKQQIFDFNDERCTMIKKEYYTYKKNKPHIKVPFEIRLVEFEKDNDLNKFKRSHKATFVDGVSKSYWFQRNHELIRLLKDDELCISVLSQFERYLNLPDNIRAKASYGKKKK